MYEANNSAWTAMVEVCGGDVAFRLTAFQADGGDFEQHMRRLLNHVDVRAILWINIAFDRITFKSITKGGFINSV